MTQFCIITVLFFFLDNAQQMQSKHQIKVGEFWFDKETIWEDDDGRPYNLAVHQHSNTLFFSYSTIDRYSDVDFNTASIDLLTKESGLISGIYGSCTVAVDNENDNVYIGGADGIYTYDMAKKQTEFYLKKGKNIWSLYFKKYLYYIRYPQQSLHIEYNGTVARVKEFEDFEVDSFFVTMQKDIYFANKTGFYKFDRVKKTTETINQLIRVRQMVEDNNGQFYVCTNFGLYTKKQNEGLKKVLNVDNMYGIAFDMENNLIYSDDRSINRLKISKSYLPDVENEYWDESLVDNKSIN